MLHLQAIAPSRTRVPVPTLQELRRLEQSLLTQPLYCTFFNRPAECRDGAKCPLMHGTDKRN